MMNNRTLAMVFLAVGLVLLFFAYQSSQSMGDQITESLTGRFTDSTIWFLIIGTASAVAGAGMLLFGRSARH